MDTDTPHPPTAPLCTIYIATRCIELYLKVPRSTWAQLMGTFAISNQADTDIPITPCIPLVCIAHNEEIYLKVLDDQGTFVWMNIDTPIKVVKSTQKSHDCTPAEYGGGYQRRAGPISINTQCLKYCPPLPAMQHRPFSWQVPRNDLAKAGCSQLPLSSQSQQTRTSTLDRSQSLF